LIGQKSCILGFKNTSPNPNSKNCKFLAGHFDSTGKASDVDDDLYGFLREHFIGLSSNAVAGQSLPLHTYKEVCYSRKLLEHSVHQQCQQGLSFLMIKEVLM